MAGFFGKLPAKGDFVDRDLPQPVKAKLDDWFQQGMHQAYKVLVDTNWEQIYTRGPIWHFYISSGVLDDQAWLGVWLPSIDESERKFPLTVLAPIDGELTGVDDLEEYQDWLLGCQELLIEAVLNQCDFEAFCQGVAEKDPNRFVADKAAVEEVFKELGIGAQGDGEIAEHKDTIEDVKEAWQRDIEAKLVSLTEAVQKIAQHTGVEVALAQQTAEIQQTLSEVVEPLVAYRHNTFDYDINLVAAAPQAKDWELSSQIAPYVIWSSKGSLGSGVEEQLVVTQGLPGSTVFELFLTGFE